MAKRKKPPNNEKLDSKNWEIRPVVAEDKWCAKKLRKGKIPEGKAPWGYIISIPTIPDHSIDVEVEQYKGYFVVRTKKRKGNLLLQIVPGRWKNAPKYGLTSWSREEPNTKRKGKYYRIINVRRYASKRRKKTAKW